VQHTHLLEDPVDRLDVALETVDYLRAVALGTGPAARGPAARRAVVTALP